MAVKAVSLVTAVAPGTNSGFKLTIYTVLLDNSSLNIMYADDLDPSISQLTLNATLTSAIKSQYGIGLLDNVRLMGSDIL